LIDIPNVRPRSISIRHNKRAIREHFE
jgi:hypothetical protein